MKLKQPLQTDIVLDLMTTEQLYTVLSQVEGQSVPALARASREARISAAKTYLRMGRLKPEVILAYMPRFE